VSRAILPDARLIPMDFAFSSYFTSDFDLASSGSLDTSHGNLRAQRKISEFPESLSE
jgi:hypothetical protein